MYKRQVEYDGDNWFFSHADANKVRQIEGDDRVHLTFADAERAAFISVWGRGQIVDDPEMKKALWQKELERWFPDGPESDDVTLVRVRAHQIQAWGSLGDHTLDLSDDAAARDEEDATAAKKKHA